MRIDTAETIAIIIPSYMMVTESPIYSLLIFFSSNVHLASSTDTIHADSFSRTPPLLYSPLKDTKIIQSPNLTDAITDDSYSNVRLASSIDTIHADNFGQDCSPALTPHVTQQVIYPCGMIAATFADSC